MTAYSCSQAHSSHWLYNPLMCNLRFSDLGAGSTTTQKVKRHNVLLAYVPASMCYVNKRVYRCACNKWCTACQCNDKSYKTWFRTHHIFSAILRKHALLCTIQVHCSVRKCGSLVLGGSQVLCSEDSGAGAVTYSRAHWSCEWGLLPKVGLGTEGPAGPALTLAPARQGMSQQLLASRQQEHCFRSSLLLNKTSSLCHFVCSATATLASSRAVPLGTKGESKFLLSKN